MERLEKNQCVIDALYAAIPNCDKQGIIDGVIKAIEEDTKLDLNDLVKDKITRMPVLDREYKVSGKGKVMRKMSVQSFIKIYNKGTYYIKTVNTAVAVRDGNIIMGTPNNKKGIVESFKIG